MTADPPDSLTRELRRLDLLLHREMLRLRAIYQLSLDEFRGLYISDEQVEAAVAAVCAEQGKVAADLASLTADAEALRQARNGDSAHDAWTNVVRQFQLNSLEQDALLLAVAPELDLKYETLYAYLNNDVTRKLPTVDLALRIGSTTPAARLSGYGWLQYDARLFTSGLIRGNAPGADRCSWLAAGLSPSPAVIGHLLATPLLDPGLAAFVTRPDARRAEMPPGVDLSLDRWVALLRAAESASAMRPIIVLIGPSGSGRSDVAAGAALRCSMSLLKLDLGAAYRASPPSWERALSLQLTLEEACLFATSTRALFDADGRADVEARACLRRLAACGAPALMAFEPECRWREALAGVRVLEIEVGIPTTARRADVWERALAARCASLPPGDLQALAERFELTQGQIRCAAERAVDAAPAPHGQNRTLTGGECFAAARVQSERDLGRLAVKAAPFYTWSDLVLPCSTLARVREVALAIRYAERVFGQWDFASRLGSTSGVKALFAGKSGTGKTMAAGVIASDLGLDLYRIDLSGIVSKYIGETERNLDAVFRIARGSGSILFFDEADALFGKRSEVKDAHDRYANIEVAYLLQKMEEHTGAVILASNLSGNIDEAFSRRIQYVVDFPVPDEQLRRRLWEGMLPDRAPLAADVDLGFLARQFAMPGGDIRNVVLAAAFQAAADGGSITMDHLVRAMARQVTKQGKLPTTADFKQYYAAATRGD